MADISFKISGDTPTFVARIYENSARSVLLHENFVDYSGTCVTFGNLFNNTCYYYSVCDRIGNQVTGTTLTPTNIFTGLEKNISMLGTPIFNQPNCVCYIDSPDNYLLINPSLSVGESVDLNFNICLCANNGPLYIENGISLYCKQAGTTTFIPKYSKGCDTEFYSTIPTIRLCCGDQICYNISSSIYEELGDATGYAKLCLVLGNSTGFTPTLGTSLKCTNLTTTTTPPPPIPDVNVFFNQVTVLNPNWSCQRVCSKLCTNPELVQGQCFRLCYTDYAYASIHSSLAEMPIIGYSCSTGVTDHNLAYVSLNPLIDLTMVDKSDSSYSYIDVTFENYKSLSFVADAKSDLSNASDDHSISASVVMNTIQNPICGNYTIGNNSISVAVHPPI